MASAAVLELRRYRLVPTRRDDLVRVFEGKLIEPQEMVGMRVGGTFWDRDDPDAFVWFRGFSGMAERHEGLTAFYGGPVWDEHGPTANATMVDSDDVHLLRPTAPSHPPAEPRAARSPVGATAASAEVVVVEVWSLAADEDADRLAAAVHPVLEEVMGVAVAMWCTETAANSFPRLPVWGEPVLVWSATFADETTSTEAMTRLDAERAARLSGSLSPVRGVRRLRLQPTARSQHPASGPPGRESS